MTDREAALKLAEELGGWNGFVLSDGNLRLAIAALRAYGAGEAQLAQAKAAGEALEKMLLKCREEFCWHGNTGKRLNTEMYNELVDQIDNALQRAKEGM